jgi:hypothetical protein
MPRKSQSPPMAKALSDPNWVCEDCKMNKHRDCSTILGATTKYGCACALAGHPRGEPDA